MRDRAGGTLHPERLRARRQRRETAQHRETHKHSKFLTSHTSSCSAAPTVHFLFAHFPRSQIHAFADILGSKKLQPDLRSVFDPEQTPRQFPRNTC